MVHEACGELVDVLPTHRDLEPIAHMLGSGRGGALDRAQARIAIGQDRDARVLIGAVVA